VILFTHWAKIESSEYPIWLGSDLAREVPGCIESFTASKHVFILADSFFKNTYCACLEQELRQRGWNVTTFFMPGGKGHKTIDSALKALSVLESMEFTRDATLVTLGGGVIGDVGGLVAALYFRGMNLVHIPTTITAQVDSSIGGKVAVNHQDTINAIGTYYHPKAIIIDLDFVKDLPDREFRSGMAEVIKAALIGDQSFCDFLLENQAPLLSRSMNHIPEMVERSIAIKLHHVQQDPREKGIRLHLNYGHTIGQAIEIATSLEHEVYRHGEAVSLGMIAAAHLADLHYADGSFRLELHTRLLGMYQLPLRLDTRPPGLDVKSLERSIYANLFKDKKRVAAGLRFVLMPEVGRAEVLTDVSDVHVRQTIALLLN
jgi:3-dehydroquinate synthase